MLRNTFLLACILSFARGWILEVSHAKVAKRLSSNITFSCFYDGYDNFRPQLKKVSRMRILKFNNNNKWEQVARVAALGKSVVTTLNDAVVTGNADKLSNSYLNISFETASDETIGSFQCDIDGYDIEGEVRVITTMPMDIGERGVSKKDILAIIVQMGNIEKRDHFADLLRIGLFEKAMSVFQPKDESSAAKLNALGKQVTDLSLTFLNVTDRLLKQQKEVSADIEQLKHINKNASWPEGVYTLLKTTTGCPFSDAFDWQTTSVGITTTPGLTHTNQSSTPFHMENSGVGPTNIVTMNSCSKVTASSGPAWPMGSYCIQAYALSSATRCPIYFQFGQVTFDRYNAAGTDPIVNLPNKVVNSDTTTLSYCCRRDRPATHPIVLPTIRPFYLYRFNGSCQKVVGMNVANEWISVDTLGAKDAYSTPYHPDGQLKNVVLQLCYYKPISY